MYSSSSKQKLHAQYLPWVIFTLSVGLIPILYPPYADFVKYGIFILGPVCLYCCQPKTEFLNNCHALASFIKPWGWWYGGILVMIIIHGVSGNSMFMNTLLIMILLFLTLRPINLQREWILWVFCLNIIIFSTLILLSLALYGVTTDLLLLNKNRLVPGITILGNICFTSYIFNRKEVSHCLRRVLLLSSVLTLCVIIFSEVRTALLGWLALTPIFFICKGSTSRRFFFLFVVIILVSFAMFWFTGRLQEGLTDLAQYNAGNSSSSWGLRLEFWKLAFLGFLSEPLVGWGYKPFTSLMDAGLPFPFKDFTKIAHFHSDYFSQLVSYGLVGVLSWLASMFFLCKDSIRDPARLSIIFSTLAMGFSERIWHYNATAIVLIMISWVLLYLSQKNTGETEALR